ncbi:MAG: hypothetical protein JXB39_05650 [Deltaproteobacteria bacterium]|nr:hypothetical protein [Deltaproteobacteria bacterium]
MRPSANLSGLASCLVFALSAGTGCKDTHDTADPQTDDTGPADSGDTHEDTGDTSNGYDGPWEILADLPEGGAWPAVAVLDGRIHAIPSNSTGHYVYDPVADEWSERAPAPSAAHYHAAAAIDGRLYLMGGGSPSAIDSLDSNRVYDPGTDAWEERAPLPTARGYLVARTLAGEVWAMGGPRYAKDTLHLRAEAYDPVKDTWRRAADLPKDTSWALYSANVVVDDVLYKLAGGIASRPEDAAWRFDPASEAWTALQDTPKANHGLAGAAVGRVITLMGGYYDDTYHDDVVRYDIDAGTYTDGPPLPSERAYSSAVALDGCVYSVGGFHSAHQAEMGVSFIRICE